MLRNLSLFATQADTHQVLSLKNAPSESSRFSAVRSKKSCALRLKIRYLGVAQLVARYLGVVEAASSSLVTRYFFAYIWLFGAVFLLFFVMPWQADSLPQCPVCSQGWAYAFCAIRESADNQRSFEKVNYCPYSCNKIIMRNIFLKNFLKNRIFLKKLANL